MVRRTPLLLPIRPDLDTIVDPEDLLAWPLGPGDVLFHPRLTLHCARGNASSDARRRGLALRYVGNDSVYDDRPATLTKTPLMRGQLPEIELRDRDPFRGEFFPHFCPR